MPPTAAPPLTLSPTFSARVRRAAEAGGFASPEDLLADALDRTDAAPPGPVETFDTPRGPVYAGGPVSEEQREAFLGMLTDRDAAFDRGEGIPWAEASASILRELRARQRARRDAPAATPADAEQTATV